MLIFNCTKAAADFFSTTQKGKKISSLEPAPEQTIAETNDPQQWQWLVHAVKVKGKHVLVVMDYQTRFSITLSALKKGDDVAFTTAFEHNLLVHIYEMMRSVDADLQGIGTSIERYGHHHQNCIFYLRGDRSVQAHINDVLWHFRNGVDNRGGILTGADLIALDTYVNQIMRKRKGEKDYFYPQREWLHAWLRHYGGHTTAQADACIDELKAKERADFAARHPGLIPPNREMESTVPSAEPDLSNVISIDAYRKK